MLLAILGPALFQRCLGLFAQQARCTAMWFCANRRCIPWARLVRQEVLPCLVPRHLQALVAVLPRGGQLARRAPAGAVALAQQLHTRGIERSAAEQSEFQEVVEQGQLTLARAR